jgi:hypothetical protein
MFAKGHLQTSGSRKLLSALSSQADVTRITGTYPKARAHSTGAPRRHSEVRLRAQGARS